MGNTQQNISTIQPKKNHSETFTFKKSIIEKSSSLEFPIESISESDSQMIRTHYNSSSYTQFKCKSEGEGYFEDSLYDSSLKKKDLMSIQEEDENFIFEESQNKERQDMSYVKKMRNSFNFNHNEKDNDKSNEMRNKYYSILLKFNLLGVKIKLNYNILIASWDDSLFSTSSLFPNRSSVKSGQKVRKIEKSKFERLEHSLFRLLSIFYSNNYDIYILSDAKKGWIEDSIKRFLPGLRKIIDGFVDLDRIRLEYSKDYNEAFKNKNNVLRKNSTINSKETNTPTGRSLMSYEFHDNIDNLAENQSMNRSICEGGLEEEKSCREKMINEILIRYRKVFEYYNIEPIMNIIIYSDFVSLIDEINKSILDVIVSKRTKSENDFGVYVKTLKLKDNPDLEDIIKQNNLLADQFNVINNSVRNLNIKITGKHK